MREHSIKLLQTLIAVGLFASIISACEPFGGYFDEYTGVNLIENRGFDYEIDDPQAGWLLDHGGPYTIFEQVSDQVATMVDVPEGVASDTPIYRLEIKNLVPNGDFEDEGFSAPIAGGSTENGWTLTGSGTTSINTTDPISGDQSMDIELTANTGVLSYDLGDTSDGLTDGLIDGALYAVRFEFYPTEELPYGFYFVQSSVVQGQIEHNWESQVPDAEVVMRFPYDFDFTSTVAAYDGTNEFRVTKKVQSLTVDNVRVVRTDIDQSLQIDLPYVDPDRRNQLALESGTYTFSVYVRRDPTVGDVSVAENRNRFDANAVTIGISSDRHTHRKKILPSDSEGGWGDWTRIEYSEFLQTPLEAEDDDIVIELSISPTDEISTGQKDAGSILIAAPSLEFSGE